LPINKATFKSSFLILLLIVTLLGYYVANHRQEFAIIFTVDYTLMLPLVLCCFLQFAVNGLFLKLFTGVFGIKLCMGEWLGLAIATTMGNYIAPLKSALLGKAMYLKKRYNFAYTDFASITLGFYILSFFLGGLMGLLLSGMVFFLYGYLSPKFIIMFSLVCAGMAGILQLGRLCS